VFFQFINGFLPRRPESETVKRLQGERQMLFAGDSREDQLLAYRWIWYVHPDSNHLSNVRPPVLDGDQ